MKIIALSDLHGHLPDVAPADIILIAGDVCPLHDHAHHYQRNWLRGDFSDWLNELQAEYIIGVPGNHDFVLEAQPGLGHELPWHYLLDSSLITRKAGDLKVYGSPWVPNLPNWAFYADDATLREKWDAIPTNIDILMTHGPPGGFGDRVFGGERVGSASLTSRLYHVQPRLHVYGHIHEGHGEWEFDDNGHLITMANVSILDELYDPKWDPTEFEIEF